MLKFLHGFLILSLLFVNYALADTKTIDEWEYKTWSLQDDEDWQGAILHAEEWVNAMPDSDLAWFYLGFRLLDNKPVLTGSRCFPEISEDQSRIC